MVNCLVRRRKKKNVPSETEFFLNPHFYCVAGTSLLQFNIFVMYTIKPYQG